MNLLKLATNSKIQSIFCVIGATYLSFKTLHLLKTVYKNYIRRPLKLLPRYSIPNCVPYALITGGAQGIGQAIAQNLASQGFNLLIFDLNCKNLPQFPANIQVKAFEVNLGSCDGWKQAAKLTEGYDIAVLVNNVGITPLEEICEFVNMNEEGIKYLLNLNMFPCVFLCHHFIPQMLKREAKSCIINISSAAAMTPQPYLSTYSATKSFINFFTQAISWEYKDKIDIIVAKPGPVKTSLNPIELNLIGITPEICAKGILRDVGYERQTFGARCHKFFNSLFEGCSVSFVGNEMKKHLTTNETMRRRERRLKEWKELQAKEQIQNISNKFEE